MSGGYFDYNQYSIKYITEKLQRVVDNPYEHIEEEGQAFRFSEETIKEFKNAVDLLNAAYIYVQRIDWLLSSDDSEETFHIRLHEDFDEQFGNTLIEIYSNS